MEAAQPYLDYFVAHPTWALVIVFLIAFGEALLIIGLFVPSTVALVGAGMLVGMGQLPFWPVFLATSIGAILGDQVSYWAGRWYGHQLKAMWPLNKYSTLVSKGEDFVRMHGGKSIAVGRFIPGIKAVVPGIVGMLGMSQPFFVFVNVTSGVAWGALHVFPGILLGQGLSVAGDLSGRLFALLLGLLVLLGIAGWLIRIVGAALAPRLRSGMRGISNWAQTRASNSRMMHRFARLASPDHPRSVNLLIYSLALFAAILGIAYLVLGLLTREAASNLDRSVATLLGELRNAHGDDLMVPLLLMGDWRVIGLIIAALVAWLAAYKAWRPLALTVSAWLAVIAGLVVLRWALDRPGPVAGLTNEAGLHAGFPNFDIALAGTAFGLLIAFAGHAMGQWSRAIVTTVCGVWVLLLAFARLYLGVAWLADITAALLLAAIAVAIFGIVIETLPARRIKPISLFAGVITLYLLGGFALVHAQGDKQSEIFESVSMSQSLTRDRWQSDPLHAAPTQRVDLAGRPEDKFIAQWRGGLEQLESHLKQEGWQTFGKWRWRDGFRYLDTKAKVTDLPPKPLLNEGLKAKLTATKALPTGERLVLRAFKSRLVVDGAPLYLLSLTREVAQTQLRVYALPRNVPADAADAADVQAMLTRGPGMRTLGQPDSVLILSQ